MSAFLNQALSFWTIDYSLTSWRSKIQRVKDLDLPEKARNFIIQEWGIENLHPPQVEAITPIMAGKNSLVAIPTASGKSLIAYIGIMRRLLVDEIGSESNIHSSVESSCPCY